MISPLPVFEPVAGESEPLISKAEAKTSLGILDNEDDILIQSIIDGATRYIEGLIGYPLRGADMVYYYPNAISANYTLTLTPAPVSTANDAIAISVLNDAAAYVDLTENVDYEATITGQDRRMVRINFLKSVSPAGGIVKSKGTRITIATILGGTTDTYPADLKQAASLLVNQWFENRMGVAMGNWQVPNEMPHAVKALIRRYERIAI